MHSQKNWGVPAFQFVEAYKLLSSKVKNRLKSLTKNIIMFSSVRKKFERERESTKKTFG